MPASRRSKTRKSSEGTRVTRALLEKTPLPEPGGDADKEDRGRVLVIGGEVSLPGALVLAGIAALRAGAGKLQIATCRSISTMVGIAVPESLSLGLDETDDGRIDESAYSAVTDYVGQCDALLLGPGTTPGDATNELVRRVIAHNETTPTIVDAGALTFLKQNPTAFHHLGGAAVITPHAKEMSAITGVNEKQIDSDPASICKSTAAKLQCVVALKGSRTFIATPTGDLYRYESGDVGLATSGSGDTLAGVIAGLVARGADPLSATLRGVYLHGAAGNALAKRIGRIGYLARELLDEIPPLMRSM
jgi:ADP-dependent NAD(P)H-hydrate dehydratase